MTPETGIDPTGAAAAAFISYCREDSEIALRLAEDLKAAGANVWLDQLDIAPGLRWDGAVEKALTTCRRMLVILSPTSVESTNVMDEVSFALEEQKVVIPIVHQECTIPFRLRRLQRVELKHGYERGLRDLLRVLAPPVPPSVASPVAPAEPVSATGPSTRDDLVPPVPVASTPVASAMVPPVESLPAPPPTENVAPDVAGSRQTPPLERRAARSSPTVVALGEVAGVEDDGADAVSRFERSGGPSTLVRPVPRSLVAGLLGAFGGAVAFGPLDWWSFNITQERSVQIAPALAVGLAIGVIQVFRAEVRPARAAIAAILSGLGWLFGEAVAIMLVTGGSAPPGPAALFVWGLLNVLPVLGLLYVVGAASLRPTAWALTAVVIGFADMVFYQSTPTNPPMSVRMIDGAIYLGAVMTGIGFLTLPDKRAGSPPVGQ